MKNPYVEEIHIAGISASCGCTTPSITKDTLKTYEKGSIIAHFNTDRFQGPHGATLTVTFDRPFYAQTQLQVTGTIRNDVIVNPGNIDFGVLEQGTPGRGDRRSLRGLARLENHRHPRREPLPDGQAGSGWRGNGIVDYHVFVRLDPKAPAGYVNDHLILITNDPAVPPGPGPRARRHSGGDRGQSEFALHGCR